METEATNTGTVSHVDLKEPGSVKLNLGSGDGESAKRFAEDGWTNIDRKLGSECYPLEHPDESVDEIRASHVLEHFSHGFVREVLSHWASKLKPGGRIRIAVPDFEWIATNYLDKRPVNVQGYTMGGQTDENDFHHTLFDFELLAEALRGVGLERIAKYDADANDCSALECSLNVEAFKPVAQVKKIEGVRALLAVPRFGPTMHARCGFEGLSGLGIPLKMSQGCFWNQILSEGMETLLEDEACRYILTLDYDTIFTRRDVVDLYRIMDVYPWVDALASVQSKRGAESVLFCAEGGLDRTIYRAEFMRLITKIPQAHFGLTMIRTEALRRLPRPWMLGKPDEDGRWSDDRTDADVMFWRNWAAAGNSLYLANHVVVGHMEELITWPDRDFKPIHQSLSDYNADGKPEEAFR